MMFSRRSLFGLYAILLSVGVLGLWGCSIVGNDEQPEFVEGFLPVDSVQVLEKGTKQVTFRIYAGWWSNSCGRISRVEAEQVNGTYDIQVYGGQPKDAICLTVMSLIVGEWEAELPAPGTYTFRFSRGAAAPLDTTITI